VKERDIGFGTIMAYYRPRWMVAVSLLVTFGTGCIYPVFGYLYAKALFALMNTSSP
jgi:hypothetical protein